MAWKTHLGHKRDYFSTKMGSHMACKTHLDHGWNNTQKQSMRYSVELCRIPFVPAKTCKAKLIYNAFQTTGKLWLWRVAWRETASQLTRMPTKKAKDIPLHKRAKRKAKGQNWNAKMFPWLLTGKPWEWMKGQVDLTNPEAICTNKICITTLKQHA